jgi:hypothetical protein
MSDMGTVEKRFLSFLSKQTKMAQKKIKFARSVIFKAGEI